MVTDGKAPRLMSIIVLVGFLFLAGLNSASAAENAVPPGQNVPSDPNSGGRGMPAQYVPLDGTMWMLAIDPQNAGRQQEWWKGPAADAKPARVPGITHEVFPAYHGVAWYWREFTPPANPHPQGRCLLRFWAVDYLAEVWLNDVHIGGHEGGETPFVLDVTEAVKPGAVNRLAVRVLNPTKEPIDGIALAETAHRNKAIPLTVGGSYNYGGITESVEVILAPAVRIEDVCVRPDWKTGKVRVQANVRNAAAATTGRVQFLIAETGASWEVPLSAASGATRIETDLQVENPRLWDLKDPCLYRLTMRAWTHDEKDCDERSVRFGFRDFRVEKGYFRLNGKRVFVRSSHTGNHCPIAHIIPPTQAPDLLRKDLLYAKASGFNMVRFIAGAAHPAQLDLCDEIGLMVYEESLAGWLLGDSPEMGERFDLSLREMMLRDRNHPCVTIWGLLNETGDGPVFRHAVASLPMLRTLDATRLILLGSGRWDGQFNIGSVSNPGGAQWECVWGVEDPGLTPAGGTPWGSFGGYANGAGDAHVYPGVPHTPDIINGIRALGRDTKPVFLSEYGIGSLMNAIRELRMYEQYRANPNLEDMRYFQTTTDKFTADWKRFGMDGVYPFPEDMLRASQRLHCRQRLLGFDCIRSNPRICGYNLTGLLDHGFTGEGLWSYWREWKPGIVDALQDGWAPVRWCVFVEPMHGYAGRPLKVEVVLANEDVLVPGDYPVTIRIAGSRGTVWEHSATASIPQPAPGEDGPLAVQVFAGDVTINGPGDAYEIAVNMDRGGAPAGGRLKFYVSDPNVGADAPKAGVENPPCAVWGIEEPILNWLKSHGVACEPFNGTGQDRRQVILVGDLAKGEVDPALRIELLRRVARGSVAVFLSPRAFKRGEDAVGWLPLKNKGHGVDFPDWLYHKECVAKAHPVFEGLLAHGIMDWDFYGPVISHYFFEGGDPPEEVIAAAFALCHSARPDGYAAGVMVGRYRFGEGSFLVNTLNVLDNVDRHPAADRLLLNMIRYAGGMANAPLVPLPADFDARLKEIGYQ